MYVHVLCLPLRVMNIVNVHPTHSSTVHLDFGVEHLVDLAGQMNFPWLMSNARCAKTGELLADGKEFHIINWEGWKVS